MELPTRRLKDVYLTRPAAENGLNASFDETVHCLAQEPTMTVLRVAVLEGDKDVAYETCLLSSLRSGYRVLHLRSLLGTRLAERRHRGDVDGVEMAREGIVVGGSSVVAAKLCKRHKARLRARRAHTQLAAKGDWHRHHGGRLVAGGRGRG